jgi:hypothetical protein
MEDAAAERAQLLISAEVNDADLLDHEKTEAIKADSFYGHAEVSLSLVEDALERSRHETGSEEAVGAFVKTSLAALPGIHLNDDDDGVFTLTGSADELAGVQPELNVRMSFRAEDGFVDPDIDVIDVAHPLLRRLVDLARDRAAHPAATGRVAARVSDAATTVTAVCHLLVRYVAHADPPVLMEELVPVVLPVWGDAPVAVDSDDLLAGDPGVARPAAELASAADALLSRTDLRARLDRAAADRAARLTTRHSRLDAPWAAGLTDIEVMSRDLLTITLVWPSEVS